MSWWDDIRKGFMDAGKKVTKGLGIDIGPNWERYSDAVAQGKTGAQVGGEMASEAIAPYRANVEGRLNAFQPVESTEDFLKTYNATSTDKQDDLWNDYARRVANMAGVAPGVREQIANVNPAYQNMFTDYGSRINDIEQRGNTAMSNFKALQRPGVQKGRMVGANQPRSNAMRQYITGAVY